MKIWKPALAILMLLALGVVVAFFISPAAFFGFLGLFAISVMAAALLAAWLLFSAILARILPGDLGGAHPGRLRFVVLVCAGFFVFAGAAANKLWLPGKLHPTSLVADGLILCVSLLLGWALLRPAVRSLGAFAAGCAAIALTVGLIAAVGPAPQTPDNTAEMKKKLAALAYLTWVPAEEGAEGAGVTYLDTLRVSEGLNIYNSADQHTANLMTVAGDIVHKWTVDARPIDSWAHIELCRNSDLLGILDGGGEQHLYRLDWNSNVVWKIDGWFHHDIAEAYDGRVYVPVRKDEFVKIAGLPVPIINEYIHIYSADGQFERAFNLFELLSSEVPRSTAMAAYRYLLDPRHFSYTKMVATSSRMRLDRHSPLNLFHANTVEVLEEDRDDVFKRGNILFCVRDLNLIGVIDPATSKVVWSWGTGEIERPHHPTFLENGNILVYDNGPFRGYSRVIEVDPHAGKIAWEYSAEPREAFWSATRGSSQRLPGGNTLICNSNSGFAFEVTGEGEVVWEFFNPVQMEGRSARAAMYRFMRIGDYERFPFLRGLAGMQPE